MRPPEFYLDSILKRNVLNYAILRNQDRNFDSKFANVMEFGLMNIFYLYIIVAVLLYYFFDAISDKLLPFSPWELKESI